MTAAGAGRAALKEFDWQRRKLSELCVRNYQTGQLIISCLKQGHIQTKDRWTNECLVLRCLPDIREQTSLPESSYFSSVYRFYTLLGTLDMGTDGQVPALSSVLSACI